MNFEVIGQAVENAKIKVVGGVLVEMLLFI